MEQISFFPCLSSQHEQKQTDKQKEFLCNVNCSSSPVYSICHPLYYALFNQMHMHLRNYKEKIKEKHILQRFAKRRRYILRRGGSVGGPIGFLFFPCPAIVV